MSLPKLFNRIIFHNNTTPALNETNLNLLSKAVDDIDDRVIDIAGTVMETVPQIQEDLEEAQDLLEDAEAISTHPPIIGQNGNWWTWDTTIEDYADSGVDAGVSVTIGTTSTLTPGSDATVTNSGTDTDPILNFGIPAGVAGQNGQDGADGADGADGISPEVTIASITGGHSVTITDADHPTGQTFNVMDGTNGQGVPSGGTTGQVLKKASNADYDTTWTTPSGGSGGHTILNGSGSAMNQRTNLQFNGMDVTDDPANDKTIVTGTPQSMIGDAWVLGHAYAVDDYAIDANGLYKNGTAHTSTATNRPSVNQSGYWTLVSVSSQLGGGGERPTLLWQQTVASGASQDFNNLSIDVTNYSKILVEVKIVDSGQELKNTSQIFYRGNWASSKVTKTYRLMGDYAGNYTMFFIINNDNTLTKVSVANSSTAGSAYTFYFSIYGL